MVNARLGNIMVPYNWTPTGAPIARGQSNTVPDHADFDVYRTPFANDIEGEAGAVWTGYPYHFNPNGVVMDMPMPPAGLGCGSCRGGLGDAAVGANNITMPPLRMRMNVQSVSSIGPTVTMALGAGAGAAFAPNHRVLGTVLGALAGGILGVLFSPG